MATTLERAESASGLAAQPSVARASDRLAAIGLNLIVAPGAADAAPPAVASAQAHAERPWVSVVMPCLNEVKTLPLCIGKALQAFEALGVLGEVVIADNGSTDGSVALAQALGARVVHQPVKGYGAALQAGIDAARGDVIVMGDADDSYDWLAIGPFLDALRGGADLVMGNRFAGGIEPGAMPWLHRWVGNPVLSMMARLAFDVPIGDFHCGMRGMTRRAWQTMRPTTTGMEFATEMIVGAARSGLQIVEIPTRLYRDQRDRPPHLRSFRDGWRHLRYILSYAPDALFLMPGAALLMVGSWLQALLAAGPVQQPVYLGLHFLALGGLLTLIGFNLLGLGAVASVVVADRYPLAMRRSLGRLLKVFTVERGLMLGSGLFAAAFVQACGILWDWLGRLGQSMEHTLHPALVATQMMALGVNIAFASFLLHLLMQEKQVKARATTGGDGQG